MNSNTVLFMFGAILAGVLIPIQTGYNTQLARALHGPMLSAVAVYVVGLAAVIGMTVALRVPLPSSDQIAEAPLISWFAGGALSAVYILLLITLAPQLGAATTVAFVVAGQILCSVVIDHFGLLGFAMREASLLRLLGLTLMAAGVSLVRLF